VSCESAWAEPAGAFISRLRLDSPGLEFGRLAAIPFAIVVGPRLPQWRNSHRGGLRCVRVVPPPDLDGFPHRLHPPLSGRRYPDRCPPTNSLEIRAPVGRRSVARRHWLSGARG